MLKYFTDTVCFALGKEVVEPLIYCLGADGNADFIVRTVRRIFHHKQAGKRAIWYRILGLLLDCWWSSQGTGRADTSSAEPKASELKERD